MESQFVEFAGAMMEMMFQFKEDLRQAKVVLMLIWKEADGEVDWEKVMGSY